MGKTGVPNEQSEITCVVAKSESDKNQETDIFRLSDQESEALIKELWNCRVMSNRIIIIGSRGLSLQFLGHLNLNKFVGTLSLNLNLMLISQLLLVVCDW